MDFLIVSILVALLAILYVWYKTRGTHSISDDMLVPLNTDDDKILVHWYKTNTKQTYNFEMNEFSIATKYLNRNYNIDINPDIIVVGRNLASQYNDLTGKILSSSYLESNDCLFDLRSTTALPIEIALIHNSHILKELRRNNNYDLTQLNSIMDSNLDIEAKAYLQEVLKIRWEKINLLDNPAVLNNNGSYLYITIPSSEIVTISSSETVTVLDSVLAYSTPHGARINLLCSNYEFEALINRLKSKF